MTNDPKTKKNTTDTDEVPDSNDAQYIEPEALDGLEPEDLDSDDEDV